MKYLVECTIENNQFVFKALNPNDKSFLGMVISPIDDEEENEYPNELIIEAETPLQAIRIFRRRSYGL